QAWLDVEVALARAQAAVGLIPARAADEIARQARAEHIDLEALKQQTEIVGYPILPLVRMLASRCGEGAGGYVHWGATTQDIMDTATVLQLRRAHRILARDLTRVVDAAAHLAARYRDTPMAGRTHGQQALPITFGFKAAVWVAEVGEAYVEGKGGSSTMPQKRNPITCEALMAIGSIVGQDAALMFAAMRPDHERATGPWHVEWEVIPEACMLAGGALHHTTALLRDLIVRPDRMARNLQLTEGLIASEAVMMALAPAIGRQRAHEI